MLGIAGEDGTNSCDILLWTTTHGHPSDGQPAKIYINQLCADTGSRLDNLPRVMPERDWWWDCQGNLSH